MTVTFTQNGQQFTIGYPTEFLAKRAANRAKANGATNVSVY